jgi:hypothetical protein
MLVILKPLLTSALHAIQTKACSPVRVSAPKVPINGFEELPEFLTVDTRVRSLLKHDLATGVQSFIP